MKRATGRVNLEYIMLSKSRQERPQGVWSQCRDLSSPGSSAETERRIGGCQEPGATEALGAGDGEGADDGLGPGVLLGMTQVFESDCADNCTTPTIDAINSFFTQEIMNILKPIEYAKNILKTT